MRGVTNFAQHLFRHLARGQFERNPVSESVLNRVVMQNASMHQAAQKRFLCDSMLCFGDNSHPNRIKIGNLCLSFSHFTLSLIHDDDIR